MSGRKPVSPIPLTCALPAGVMKGPVRLWPCGTHDPSIHSSLSKLLDSSLSGPGQCYRTGLLTQTTTVRPASSLLIPIVRSERDVGEALDHDRLLRQITAIQMRCSERTYLENFAKAHGNHDGGTSLTTSIAEYCHRAVSSRSPSLPTYNKEYFRSFVAHSI